VEICEKPLKNTTEPPNLHLAPFECRLKAVGRGGWLLLFLVQARSRQKKAKKEEKKEESPYFLSFPYFVKNPANFPQKLLRPAPNPEIRSRIRERVKGHFPTTPSQKL
jgi:hypothetical protein